MLTVLIVSFRLSQEYRDVKITCVLKDFGRGVLQTAKLAKHLCLKRNLLYSTPLLWGPGGSVEQGENHYLQ